jgi:fumarylacetoacetase
MINIDATHDPLRRSWVDSANEHVDFPIQNLPLGVFTTKQGAPRIGMAIGNKIVDLNGLSVAGLLPDAAVAILTQPQLNDFMASDATLRQTIRQNMSILLSDPKQRVVVSPFLHDAVDCKMQLPARIGDYTDFYTGIHHANNIGKQFRPDSPLLPNYKHVPIGYHGRASSIRVSGADVVRPSGQTRAANAESPQFGPSRRLDYELELGIWVGQGNLLGEPVAIGHAAQHIAGYSLLNDWSARDIQAWEYQPLGPFLAKNFLSTISPWIITAEALAPFRIAQPPRPQGDPQPLPYLWDDMDQQRGALSIQLEVYLQSAQMRAASATPMRLSHGSALNMYWTPAQLIAHHSSNGCDLQPGDLLGTGTLSSSDPSGFGSLMELSMGGTAPLSLPTGETRTFLEDGDIVIMRAKAEAAGFCSIGFGACIGQILPAKLQTGL